MGSEASFLRRRRLAAQFERDVAVEVYKGKRERVFKIDRKVRKTQ